MPTTKRLPSSPKGVLVADLDQAVFWSDEGLTALQATPEQFERSLNLIVDVWKGPLTTEQAHEKLRLFLKTRFGSESMFFVLVPSHQPKTLDIRATCTLAPVELLVMQPGDLNIHQAAGMRFIWTVVPPIWRGRGYATRLASELASMNLPTSKPPLAAYGFSECGRRIWERVGAKCPEGIEASVPMTRFLDTDSIHVELLGISGIYENLSADVAQIRGQLAAARTNAIRIALNPTLATYEATFGKEDAGPGESERLPTIFGAKVSDRSFAYWVYVAHSKALEFVRFAAASVEDARILLRAASREAEKQHLERLVAWDFDVEIANELGVNICESEENVPTLFASGVVEWVAKERFAKILEGVGCTPFDLAKAT